MFFKKKEESVTPNVVKKTISRSELLIRFIYGEEQRIWQDGTKSIYGPWKKFYDWWFRRNSNSYEFSGKDFSIVIRREDIREFRVRVYDVEMEG